MSLHPLISDLTQQITRTPALQLLLGLAAASLAFFLITRSKHALLIAAVAALYAVPFLMT
jgi:hypothetical protein